ncbi:DUF2922 domain-containing protein [Lactobacillus sp. W8093]|uniref:DUF2922 domain-containing protein n=1 Tax=Lactobacillus sp. W8093 TaxID=2751038 RepID=UPI0018EFE166|nr:DUF2922 domain-containing protein [Lactobacillus sp. W8093]MBI0111246.1 DUF2922 domain-containing protein [Lactobacillus sp. W8093]
MVIKSKTLRLVFLNGANKKVSLSLPNAADNLAATEVKAAMAAIANANVFAQEGVDLYQTPQSASYVERTVTSLFDDTAAQPM